jgi:hypothetical protein
MKDQVTVISLVDQHEDGNLWFGIHEPETPQRLFDFIKNNIDEGEKVELVIEKVSKAEYEREQ